MNSIAAPQYITVWVSDFLLYSQGLCLMAMSNILAYQIYILSINEYIHTLVILYVR